jgi:hypothetical protein
VLAAETPTSEVGPLIRHLRGSGQLNAGLILRALLSGNIVLFEEALAELADMPVARVSALVHDRGSAGLRALLDRARLPPSTYPAFKAAIEAMHEGGFVGEPGGTVRLKRRMVERVLTGCGKEALGDVAPLLTLLRRFATEAARRRRACSATSWWPKLLTRSRNPPPPSLPSFRGAAGRRPGIHVCRSSSVVRRQYPNCSRRMRSSRLWPGSNSMCMAIVWSMLISTELTERTSL